jgi:hypothetical protein
MTRSAGLAGCRRRRITLWCGHPLADPDRPTASAAAAAASLVCTRGTIGANEKRSAFDAWAAHVVALALVIHPKIAILSDGCSGKPPFDS